MGKLEIVSVGADPEWFVKEGKVFRSAHDLVPGTKAEPAPLRIKGGAVQADGVAIEANIPPSYTREEFASNIQAVVNEIRTIVPEKFEFSFDPVADFDKAYFKTIPAHALELGCDPDYSGANQGNINPRPKPAGDMEFARSGGGHIHVGFNKVDNPKSRSHIWDCSQVACALDQYIGAHSVLWDQDKRRAKLYGAGAAFRPKKYGMELRSPSNAWLKHPALWPWLFDVVQHVNKTLYDGNYRSYIWQDVRYAGQVQLKSGGPIKGYQNTFHYPYRKCSLEELCGELAARMNNGPVFPAEAFKNG